MNLKDSGAQTKNNLKNPSRGKEKSRESHQLTKKFAELRRTSLHEKTREFEMGQISEYLKKNPNSRFEARSGEQEDFSSHYYQKSPKISQEESSTKFKQQSLKKNQEPPFNFATQEEDGQALLSTNKELQAYDELLKLIKKPSATIEEQDRITRLRKSIDDTLQYCIPAQGPRPGEMSFGQDNGQPNGSQVQISESKFTQASAELLELPQRRRGGRDDEIGKKVERDEDDQVAGLLRYRLTPGRDLDTEPYEDMSDLSFLEQNEPGEGFSNLKNPKV